MPLGFRGFDSKTEDIGVVDHAEKSEQSQICLIVCMAEESGLQKMRNLP